MDIGSIFNLDPEIIIGFMNSLLDMVFQTAQDAKLQEWGTGVIETVGDSTEKQVIDQLGYDPRD